jgi:hypothetical protein
MNQSDSFLFYPKKILTVGGAVLTLGLLSVLPIFYLLYFHDLPTRETIEMGEPQREILSSFSGLSSDSTPLLPIPDLLNEMTFSFDPPRPDGGAVNNQVLIRLRKSGVSKRETLPCRLGLQYQGEGLTFAKEPTHFWVELQEKDKKIDGCVFFLLPDKEKTQVARFSTTSQECPIQSPHEFPEHSPLRTLAEARWLGRDQFQDYLHPDENPFSFLSGSRDRGERIELPSGILDLSPEEWLTWKEGNWVKVPSLEQGLGRPVFRILDKSQRALILEGWDPTAYVKLSLASSLIPNAKIKGEDLFSAVRVRSEKQVSCLLEKQCLILKMGDWVVKTGGKWRVLRRKEERESFEHGKLVGDLFILEQIGMKQGQKTIQGRFFNMNRTYTTAIEVAAQTPGKGGKRRSG